MFKLARGFATSLFAFSVAACGLGATAVCDADTDCSGELTCVEGQNTTDDGTTCTATPSGLSQCTAECTEDADCAALPTAPGVEVTTLTCNFVCDEDVGHCGVQVVAD